MNQTEPRFGTDGIRGIANTELTPLLALKLGMAATYVLGRHTKNPRILVGKDTRLSGDMLEAALNAGVASLGGRAIHLGVAPTPAVSRLTVSTQAAAGVVSASHNPFHDNGIKFFGADGRKLSDAVEDEIERAMKDWESLPRPDGAEIGHIVDLSGLVADYISQLKATAGDSLRGMRLVLDCANGATYAIAPQLFADLGAEVRAIHVEPNGVNINAHCGSTKPADLQAYVVKHGADVGLAFDGDGDRVMLCDERGEIVDGDRMLLICALAMQRHGNLTNETVVATIMSNAGLDVALERQGIRLLRTDVGDRYVAEAMCRTDAALGGEQSGHLLFPHLSPTGDGMMTGLQVLKEMQATGRRLSDLASTMYSCPQILRNVRVRSRTGWEEVPEIAQSIAVARTRLTRPDWLSVRASGTEPLIRVMAQDTEADRVEQIVGELCDLIQQHVGA